MNMPNTSRNGEKWQQQERNRGSWHRYRICHKLQFMGSSRLNPFERKRLLCQVHIGEDQSELAVRLKLCLSILRKGRLWKQRSVSTDRWTTEVSMTPDLGFVRLYYFKLGLASVEIWIFWIVRSLSPKKNLKLNLNSQRPHEAEGKGKRQPVAWRLQGRFDIFTQSRPWPPSRSCPPATLQPEDVDAEKFICTSISFECTSPKKWMYLIFEYL